MPGILTIKLPVSMRFGKMYLHTKKKKKKVTKKNNNRKCLKNFFKRIMYLKDAEEMTNIADPDQTAPEEGAVCSESALFLKPICTNM